MNVISCTDSAVQVNDCELIPTVESQHSVHGPTSRDFSSIYIVREYCYRLMKSEVVRTEVGFWKKTTPCGKILKISFRKDSCAHGKAYILCANFVKFSQPEVGEIESCLHDKKSASAPALASARIAPKICHGQPRTTYSEFPKFHPNPFTSRWVIAERVNIVQTRCKVVPILGDASSPSNLINV